MFSTLRNRFGIPGVISVIALVFAMIGGAYAASNSGEGKGATASAKKAAKGPRGPRGPKGATGAAGPTGPAGAKGDTGTPGANGGPGKDGQSVTGAPIAAGGACGPGVTGVKYTLGATSTNVCNGKEGPVGEEGDPWTDGGVLPPEATETGLWAVGEIAGSPSFVRTAISFPIPLAAPLGASEVHYINELGQEVITPGNEVTPDDCPGTAAEPKADPGHLCIYEASKNPEISFSNSVIENVVTAEQGAGTTGAVLGTNNVAAEGRAAGTWAVTAAP